MKTAALVYPHQLFDPHPALADADCAFLIEDPLFFTQYPFHQQKLVLHRASMKGYAAKLRDSGLSVTYIEACQLKHTSDLATYLTKGRIKRVQLADVSDDWLERRLTAAIKKAKIECVVLPDPHFLTSREQITEYTRDKKKLFFTDFYIRQRKRLGLLLEEGEKPVGGQWSFDPDNRKKLPANATVPKVSWPKADEHVAEAQAYVQKIFAGHYGTTYNFAYPINHQQAKAWLKQFVRDRLALFGDYEDAMSSKYEIVFHSVLTPMLNIGLISPQEIIDEVMKQADDVPLNSLEGFLRQVIGWREFIRLVYLTHGRKQRTSNFWKLTKPMPKAFYDGTTGIEPVDHVIRQVLRTGYCHHIERLMILGNFLVLCDIHPDAVYQWFMELFIDAYDWVMVPNTYGMSQQADGGLMTTKPYISGSAYVLKMSDFKRGPWCPIWDALYWRFIDKHTEFFAANPRMAMMAKMKEKLGDKMIEHRRVAEEFLKRLHG
jgi:deoxyribodipyrimidine photolyase-related protein